MQIDNPSVFGSTYTIRREIMWQSYQRKGMKGASIKMLMEHLLQNTIKQYSPAIFEWIEFCKTENICHFSAPVAKIIDFLTIKFQK